MDLLAPMRSWQGAITTVRDNGATSGSTAGTCCAVLARQTIMNGQCVMSLQSGPLLSQSGISPDMVIPGIPPAPALTGAVAEPITRPTTAKIMRRRDRVTRNRMGLGYQ